MMLAREEAEECIVRLMTMVWRWMDERIRWSKYKVQEVSLLKQEKIWSEFFFFFILPCHTISRQAEWVKWRQIICISRIDWCPWWGSSYDVQLVYWFSAFFLSLHVYYLQLRSTKRDEEFIFRKRKQSYLFLFLPMMMMMNCCVPVYILTVGVTVRVLLDEREVARSRDTLHFDRISGGIRWICRLWSQEADLCDTFSTRNQTDKRKREICEVVVFLWATNCRNIVLSLVKDRSRRGDKKWDRLRHRGWTIHIRSGVEIRRLAG